MSSLSYHDVITTKASSRHQHYIIIVASVLHHDAIITSSWRHHYITMASSQQNHDVITTISWRYQYYLIMTSSLQNHGGITITSWRHHYIMTSLLSFHDDISITSWRHLRRYQYSSLFSKRSTKFASGKTYYFTSILGTIIVASKKNPVWTPATLLIILSLCVSLCECTLLLCYKRRRRYARQTEYKSTQTHIHYLNPLADWLYCRKRGRQTTSGSSTPSFSDIKRNMFLRFFDPIRSTHMNRYIHRRGVPVVRVKRTNH